MILSQSLQENILTLLCFSDEYALMIRSVTDHFMFEDVYHPIVLAAYKHLDEYREAPKQHISDVLDTIQDQDIYQFVQQTLILLFENTKEINAQAVVNKLTLFIDQQHVKHKMIELNERLLADVNPDKDMLDEIYTLMSEIVKSRHVTFDPGFVMNEESHALSFLAKDEREAFLTGISALDDLGIGPAREELFVFMALLNKGKTWFLTHLGTRAIMQRVKVLHITLEVSQEIMAKRYLQTLFGFTVRDVETWKSHFVLHPTGELQAIQPKKYRASFSLQDSQAESRLQEKFAQAQSRLRRLRIKRFPTGQLTYTQLVAYLDMLEQTEHFIPDMILIDYVELMNISLDNYRMQLGKLYTKLRGLAVERNLAMVTVTQSNREGVGAAVLTAKNVNEDFSKFQTADTVVSYTQSEKETELKLARLYVIKARNARANDTFLISQNYDTGQFCLSCVPYRKTYSSLY